MPGRFGTDVGGLRREVKRSACIEAGLGSLAGREKMLAGCIECSVKGSQESKSTLCQNLRLCLGSNSNFGVDLQAGGHDCVGCRKGDRGSHK